MIVWCLFGCCLAVVLWLFVASLVDVWLLWGGYLLVVCCSGGFW